MFWKHYTISFAFLGYVHIACSLPSSVHSSSQIPILRIMWSAQPLLSTICFTLMYAGALKVRLHTAGFNFPGLPSLSNPICCKLY